MPRRPRAGLFVYLAREAPLAVVLRRGPSAWVRLSRWHTDTDVLEHGQWMQARVYERRSDLSADGSLFLAFVRQTTGQNLPDRDIWLALSGPPWFTALAHWLVGGAYHTGGYFPARGSLWPGFSSNPPDGGAHPAWLTTATGPPPYLDGTPNWTERTVWLNRLLRDGWQCVADASPETWEHDNPAAGLSLEMVLRSDADFTAHDGPHVVDYAVRHGASERVVPIGRATWADWDRRGRLIVARDGRLWHWQRTEALQEIANFNGQTPAPAPAPGWARTWPAPSG